MDAIDIQRAYAGGEQARRDLAERLWTTVRRAVARKLFPIARSSGRDPSQDLDDFVNGVFLSLFENDWRILRRFDPDQGSLDAYISTIAARHVLGTFRVKSRDPYAELPMQDEAIERRRGEDEGLERRVRARSELDELYAYLRTHLDESGLLLFHMLIVDGAPVEQVCERLELSREAVYKRRSRIKQAVRAWRLERET